MFSQTSQSGSDIPLCSYSTPQLPLPSLCTHPHNAVLISAAQIFLNDQFRTTAGYPTTGRINERVCFSRSGFWSRFLKSLCLISGILVNAWKIISGPQSHGVLLLLLLVLKHKASFPPSTPPIFSVLRPQLSVLNSVCPSLLKRWTRTRVGGDNDAFRVAHLIQRGSCNHAGLHPPSLSGINGTVLGLVWTAELHLIT